MVVPTTLQIKYDYNYNTQMLTTIFYFLVNTVGLDFITLLN